MAMNKPDLISLIQASNASIPEELLDEVQKIVDLQESKHNATLAEYENVLKKLARWFRKDADKVDTVNPDAFYTKILWGIHDNMDKFSR